MDPHTKTYFPESPTMPTGPPTLLDREIPLLLAEARRSSVRDFTMISLCLCTGLRNAELLALRTENISPYGIITNILELPAEIAKGHHPRSIPLRSGVKLDLEAFYIWKEHNSEPVLTGNFLFLTARSQNKLLPRDFQRIVSTISARAIGRCITPHTLRHTFATKLLRISNLKIVQEVLGHRNIQTTQLYVHPSSDEVEKAINRM